MDGASVPVKVYGSGRDRVLRIGDPDKTITGTHVYRIEYTASRALVFHDNYLQLYWNVTGTEWEIPIRQATATLSLPPDISPDLVSTTSYAGPWGSSGRGTPVTLDAAGRFLFTTGTLNPGSGLTIDVSIPRSAMPLNPPTFAQNLVRFLWDNKLALLPIATLVFMIVLWSRTGRDPRKGTIAPAFEPPSELGPGGAGVLVDDRIDLRDISAMVIGLAVSGHLSIREDAPETDSLADKARAWVGGSTSRYTFVRGRRSPDDLAPADRALYDAIFQDAEAKETPLSALENRFYKHLPTIRIRLYDGLIQKRFYAQNPERVRQAYAGWGGALIAAGVGVGDPPQLHLSRRLRRDVRAHRARVLADHAAQDAERREGTGRRARPRRIHRARREGPHRVHRRAGEEPAALREAPAVCCRAGPHGDLGREVRGPVTRAAAMVLRRADVQRPSVRDVARAPLVGHAVDVRLRASDGPERAFRVGRQELVRRRVFGRRIRRRRRARLVARRRSPAVHGTFTGDRVGSSHP